jgi:hypothetical protein
MTTPSTRAFQLPVSMNQSMNFSAGASAVRYSMAIGPFLVISNAGDNALYVLRANSTPKYAAVTSFATNSSVSVSVSGGGVVSPGGFSTFLGQRPSVTGRFFATHPTGLWEYSIDLTTGAIALVGQWSNTSLQGVADSGSVVCTSATGSVHTVYCYNTAKALIATLVVPLTQYYNLSTVLANTDMVSNDLLVSNFRSHPSCRVFLLERVYHVW